MRRHSPKRWTPALWVALWLWSPLATAADSTPSLPGAVTKAPTWLGSGVPFDVSAHFAAPPPEENAASLYLDALFEFTGDVYGCFPVDFDREFRKADAEGRMRRWQEIDEALKKEPKSVPAEQIDALLADYEPGWQKIIEAQKRPKCVFQTGIRLNSPLTHAQAARQVVRVASLRTRRALERNDLETPIDNLKIVLRLSRDLRPRGYPITQLVSAAMDFVAYRDLVTPILNDPHFSAQTSAALMDVLLEHDRSAIEPFAEGVKSDYLCVRSTMSDAVQRGPELARELGGAPGDSLVGTVMKRVNENTPLEKRTAQSPPNHPALHQIDAQIANLKPVEIQKDVDWINAYYGALLALAPKLPADRNRELPDPREKERFTNDWLSKFILLLDQNYEDLNRSFGRDVASLRGTECLIALRLWQVVEKTPPTDLFAICQAVGLPAVPIDPHSGKPMKMAIVDGTPVIYSIGIDGKDDGGLVDSKNETVPGDILFRLTP